MLPQLEDAVVVHADALEDTVAIEQTVVEDADGGVGFVAQLTVDVDLHEKLWDDAT